MARGTLKIEIIKPIGADYAETMRRLRALQDTLPQALNMAMRAVHPHAVEEIDAILRGEKPDSTWRSKVEKLIRQRWNEALVSRKEYLSRRAKKLGVVDERAHLPVTEALTAETADNILSRFAGEHLKDLLACRASFPSFNKNGAFFARSRTVEIAGASSVARLKLPLFGAGSKTTEFAVAPSGSSAEAVWDRLVAGVPRRAWVVEKEAEIKRLKSERSQASKDGDEKSEKRLAKQLAKAQSELSTSGVYKLGRVGVKYDERRHKWFALISWSSFDAADKVSGQTAALVYGANVHMFAMAEDGATWQASGADIVAARKSFQSRRRQLQSSLNAMGSGSRGHGKRRRWLPITRLSDAEHRFVSTRIQTLGAELAAWCGEHNVAAVVTVDMSGTRDAFEKRTDGEAHVEVKRLIHSWPYHAASQWAERQLGKRGVSYSETDKKALNAACCPRCKHTDGANIADVPGQIVEYRVIDGKAFTRRDVWRRFECQKCGLSGQLEAIEAANLLVASGAKHSLEKMQTDARKRIRKEVESASGSDDEANESAAE